VESGTEHRIAIMQQKPVLQKSAAVSVRQVASCLFHPLFGRMRREASDRHSTGILGLRC
jgi:hypothetical protein